MTDAVSIPQVCLIMQPIHAGATTILQKASLQVIEGIDAGALRSAVVAVITRDACVDSRFMDQHPRLRVIVKHGTGLDAIATQEAAARGISVIATPGLNARSVAEHALLLMLALARNLPAMMDAVLQGDLSARSRLTQREITGARLGLMGFGQVGQRLAVLAGRGFGMSIRALSPSVPDSVFRDHGVERCQTVTELFAECDIISLQVPARPGSSGLIGAAQLAQLPYGAILINVGRGGIIDEDAAADALQSGYLGGLGLDVMAREPIVPGHRLLGMANVIITPHVGGSSSNAMISTGARAAAAVVNALRSDVSLDNL